MHATVSLLEDTDFPALRRAGVETLQVNLGYRCNQACLHCHVNAAPTRTEMMSRDTVDLVLAYVAASGVRRLDVTGGAPELNPHFRYLVEDGRRSGVHVVDRCNLTVLEQPGQEDLVAFLAGERVDVIASLPCYLEENVDRQRGRGVFAASIRGLQRLNDAGYGRPGSGLELNLVFNPQGPTLPPPQTQLEAAYREHLGARHGVVFTRLYTLTNMPINRFGSQLVSRGQFHRYISLLRASFEPANVESVMCRTLLSVDWRGDVYDCDFNQMLDLPLRRQGRTRTRLADLMGVDLSGDPIAVMDHCYGCTAGQGSSCGGALAAKATPG